MADPTSKAAIDLLETYKSYKGMITEDERVSMTPPTPSKLWDDSESIKFPPLPKNASGTIKVSKLLKTTPVNLPGPDFEMPVFDSMESWPENVKQYIPEITDQDICQYVYNIEAAYWFCYALRSKKPAFLSGVKGCGKSTMPKRIAAELQWPFLRKQMSKTMDSSEFFGTWTVKDGETKFAKGDLPLAAEAGMIFMIDEISNAPNELHPSLHQALEKNGSIYLNSSDGTIADKIVVPKDTFWMCATDNTRGQGDVMGHYAGTDVMNSATMDRFLTMIVMDYLPVDREIEVLTTSVPGCTNELAKRMLQVACHVRKAYAAGDLSETLSTRPLLEWAEKAVFTRDVMGSLKYTTLNKISSDSERQEIETYVRNAFGSLLGITHEV